MVLLDDAARCAFPFTGMGTTGNFVGVCVLAGEINRQHVLLFSRDILLASNPRTGVPTLIREEVRVGATGKSKPPEVSMKER